jgi:glycosyltransferase involved in cell wall biosynthesis
LQPLADQDDRRISKDQVQATPDQERERQADSMREEGAGSLRIATISKSDLFGGGASRVAQMLADQFARSEYHSVHFCNRPGGGFGIGRRPFSRSEIANEAIRNGHAIARKLGFAESLPLDSKSLLNSIDALSANVVHVHDTTSAVSPVTLNLLSGRLPLVWTLHDASPFTGGCIFPGDCRRFQIGCGRCPQHGQWPLDGLVDLTALHRRLRKQVHATGRVLLLTPSQWMSDLAYSSGMLVRPPTIMPNPVDTTLFAPPPDKAALRRKLGLPQDRLVLIGVAGDVSDPRKGMAEFLATASSLADLDPHFILIGKEDPRLAERLRDLNVMVTGFVASASELAEYYGASDALVFCSSMDNQPLTILEAMACGIPTFGFAVGGAGELVTQGENGFMVSHGESEELAAMIRQASLAGAMPKMGGNARRYAVHHHEITEVAARHLELYRSLVRPPDEKPTVPTV